MNKLELTLLDHNQITYGEEYLDIIGKVGTKCAITDFAILLGGLVSDYHLTKEGYASDNKSKYHTGSWWTKTLKCKFECSIGANYGGWSCKDVLDRQVGIRPALSYSSISQICTNKVSGFKEITEVEYGEYPQYIVAEELSEILEQLYMNKDITQTSKTYTTDSVESIYYRAPLFFDSELYCEKEYFVYEYHSEKHNVEKYKSYSELFRAKGHIVYEYNGKKYVRLEAPSYCTGSVLSNGKEVEEGKAYWLEVEPIKWMIDEKANIALSKNIIVSGIQFDRNNYTGDFEETEIYKFMNDILAKDIIPSNMSKEDIQEGVSSEDILDNDVVNVIEETSKSNDVDVTEKAIQPETILEDVPTDDEAEATKQMVKELSDSNYVNEEAIQVVVASKDILGNDEAEATRQMFEDMTGSNDITSILMMIIKILTEAAPLPQEIIKKINQLLEKMATAYAGSESLVAEISELIKKNQDGLIMPSSDMQFIKQT